MVNGRKIVLEAQPDDHTLRHLLDKNRERIKEAQSVQVKPKPKPKPIDVIQCHVQGVWQGTRYTISCQTYVADLPDFDKLRVRCPKGCISKGYSVKQKPCYLADTLLTGPKMHNTFRRPGDTDPPAMVLLKLWPYIKPQRRTLDAKRNTQSENTAITIGVLVSSHCRVFTFLVWLNRRLKPHFGRWPKETHFIGKVYNGKTYLPVGNPHTHESADTHVLHDLRLKASKVPVLMELKVCPGPRPRGRGAFELEAEAEAEVEEEEEQEEHNHESDEDDDDDD